MTIAAVFFFDSEKENRKKLFEKALFHAKDGKVLYILQEELNEIPELSLNFSSIKRHYLKMISFLYTINRMSLVESLASLTEWQYVPSTIILDSLDKFSTKTNMHSACSIVAILLDSARSCSLTNNTTCHLYIAVSKEAFNEQNFNLIQELYMPL